MIRAWLKPVVWGIRESDQRHHGCEDLEGAWVSPFIRRFAQKVLDAKHYISSSIRLLT